MFTAILVLLTAAAGGSCGLTVNRKVMKNRQSRTRHQARRYVATQRGQDQHRRDLLIQKERLSVQRYRSAANHELDDQIHDNGALARRLRSRAIFLDRNEVRLGRLQDRYRSHSRAVKAIKERYRATLDRAATLKIHRHRLLNRISSIDDHTARAMVLNQTAAKLGRERDVDVKEAVENASGVADQKANDIIVEAIQRGPVDQPRNHIERSVDVPDRLTKHRLLNRNDQHLRLVESVTGTNLLFDSEDPLMLHIITHDPIRRETARRTLSNLIVSRHITNSNIEVQVRYARKEVDYELREIGERVVREMDLGWMHPDLIKILGRLKFRTSYGQNVLYHSMEVGQMTGVMAAELGMNPRLARRAGLLHDVGKSIDHEVTGTHVELGVKLAQTYHEDPIVINAIAAHHGDVEPTSPISLLVSTADALSGARPGARSESIEEYIKRLKNLESIANQQPGVRESYAIQAGRELRIIIDPHAMSDAQSAQLTKHVRDRIQNELSYPGKIKITTIRTLKAIQYVGGRRRHRHRHRSRRRATE